MWRNIQSESVFERPHILYSKRRGGLHLGGAFQGQFAVGRFPFARGNENLRLRGNLRLRAAGKLPDDCPRRASRRNRQPFRSFQRIETETFGGGAVRRRQKKADTFAAKKHRRNNVADGRGGQGFLPNNEAPRLAGKRVDFAIARAGNGGGRGDCIADKFRKFAQISRRFGFRPYNLNARRRKP